MQHDITVQTSHPGRMAPNTALSFLLAGTGLILTGWLGGHRWAPILKAVIAALVMGLGLVALSGYLIDLPTAYGWTALTQMALQTSIGIFILGGGLLALAWREATEQHLDLFAWLPIPAGIGIATTAILLWQALNHSLAEIGLEGVLFHHLILVFGFALALALAGAIHQIQQGRVRTAIAERSQRELEALAHKHRMAEQALAESEALLNTTSSQARVGGWEVDAETLEVTWTDETHRIHGLPAGVRPPLDKAIDFFHPEDRATLRAAIDSALAHGAPYDLQLRIIRADGTEIWTRVTCQPEVVDGRV